MVVCNLHRSLLSKVMNVIVYVMCLLNPLMSSLRVISILCSCMLTRLDLHMLIITFHTSCQILTRSFVFLKKKIGDDCLFKNEVIITNMPLCD